MNKNNKNKRDNKKGKQNLSFGVSIREILEAKGIIVESKEKKS